jgi:hypothetical protein
VRAPSQWTALVGHFVGRLFRVVFTWLGDVVWEATIVPWFRGRILWRLLQLCCICLVAIALASAASLFWPTRQDEFPSGPLEESIPAGADAIFMLADPQVDLDSNELNARALLYISKETLRSLEDENRKLLAPHANGATGIGDVPAEMRATVFPVSVDDFGPDAWCDKEVPPAAQEVPLRQMLARGTSAVRGPVNAAVGFSAEGLALSLPMRGRPERFPQDSYVALLPELKVCWPPGVTSGGGPLARSAVYAAFGGVLPSREYDVTSQRLVTYSGTYPDQASESWEFHAQFLEVRRNTASRRITYVIAVAPSLLLAAAVFQWRRWRKSDGSLSGVSLELGASLLAILPLRQVLVPSDIRGLTWLDYLLAFQVLAVIALAVLAAGPSQRTPTAASP